jgi:hypothetical protein
MTIIYDMPLAEYHESPYLSSSKLVDFSKRGPRYFASRYVQRNCPADDSTDSQVFGQAFEDAVFGIGLKGYAIKPLGHDGRTKAGKEWAASNAGKPELSSDDVATIEAMHEALLENESAAELLRVATLQATVRCNWPGTPGLQSRPDMLVSGCAVTGFQPASVDLKSTLTIAKLTSGRGVADYRYHVQGAICRRTLAENGVAARSLLIACEKISPHRCVVIEMPTSWLDAGWSWAERQLVKLAGHYRSNHWPRAEREMVSLPPVPQWVAGSGNDAEEDAA